MTARESADVNRARTQKFAERMTSVLNDSFLGMMLSIGHQTGLLDSMADLDAATSQEIAPRAGLDERYVRE